MSIRTLVQQDEETYDPLWRPKGIGEFFAKLTVAMVGGELNPFQHNEHPNRIDINHWKWGARIEAKGSTNQSSPRLWVSQLRGFQASLGDFFGEHVWYALFFYRGRDGRRSVGEVRRVSAETPTPTALHGFLCQHTRLLGLFDISVIQAMADQGLTTTCLHRGKPDQVVQFSETALKKLADFQTLTGLGLSHGRLTVQTYQVSGVFEGVALTGFRVIQILPPRFHAKVRRAVGRNFLVRKS